MRLWTLHPCYLDAKGLVAAWREALLAQAVLRGETRGYRNHPQLIRFQAAGRPRAAIASFLTALADEATRRGYRFDATKIRGPRLRGRLTETRGQLEYEWAHLRRKLRTRDPERWRKWADVRRPKPHPLFRIVPGRVRDWEKT